MVVVTYLGDGWMNGWMDEWMDGWMDERSTEQMSGVMIIHPHQKKKNKTMYCTSTLHYIKNLIPTE